MDRDGVLNRMVSKDGLLDEPLSDGDCLEELLSLERLMGLAQLGDVWDVDQVGFLDLDLLLQIDGEEQ